MNQDKLKVVEPIRSKEDLKLIIEWFKKRYPKYAVIFLLGISSGLRISDILGFDVGDVYQKDEVVLRERKTEKYKKFPLRPDIREELNTYCKGRSLSEPLFMGRLGCRLDRSQVYRFINRACEEIGISANVGTHTMRKTFGYHHYKQFHDIAILQNIFNHSSPEVTKRYIGITQDEINESYLSLNLFESVEDMSYIKPKLTSRIKARRGISYLTNYLKNGGTRHREFAMDLLDVMKG